MSRGAYELPPVVCVTGRDTGKTSLITRYLHNEFTDAYVEEESNAVVKVDGVEYAITLLDTSGDSQYENFLKKWYARADAFIVCYSVSNWDSFDVLQKLYLPEIENVKRARSLENIPIVLVGLKCDCEDAPPEVSEDDAKKLAEQMNCCSMRVSSLRSVNVNKPFEEIVIRLAALGRSLRTTIFPNRRPCSLCGCGLPYYMPQYVPVEDRRVSGNMGPGLLKDTDNTKELASKFKRLLLPFPAVWPPYSVEGLGVLEESPDENNSKKYESIGSSSAADISPTPSPGRSNWKLTRGPSMKRVISPSEAPTTFNLKAVCEAITKTLGKLAAEPVWHYSSKSDTKRVGNGASAVSPMACKCCSDPRRAPNPEEPLKYRDSAPKSATVIQAVDYMLSPDACEVFIEMFFTTLHEFTDPLEVLLCIRMSHEKEASKTLLLKWLKLFPHDFVEMGSKLAKWCPGYASNVEHQALTPEQAVDMLLENANFVSNANDLADVMKIMLKEMSDKISDPAAAQDPLQYVLEMWYAQESRPGSTRIAPRGKRSSSKMIMETLDEMSLPAPSRSQSFSIHDYPSPSYSPAERSSLPPAGPSYVMPDPDLEGPMFSGQYATEANDNQIDDGGASDTSSMDMPLPSPMSEVMIAERPPHYDYMDPMSALAYVIYEPSQVFQDPVSSFKTDEQRKPKKRIGSLFSIVLKEPNGDSELSELIVAVLNDISPLVIASSSQPPGHRMLTHISSPYTYPPPVPLYPFDDDLSIDRNCDVIVLPDPNADVETVAEDMALECVDPIEIARQLYLVVQQVFQSIEPREFVGCLWTKKDKQYKVSPHIMKAIELFNNIAKYFATYIILSEQCVGEKVELLGAARILRTIQIASSVWATGNFFALTAVISALQSMAVQGLHSYWDHVPAPATAKLNELTKMTSGTSNFKELRKVVKEWDGWTELVPFLGVRLSDLVKIDDFMQDDAVNFTKFRLLFNVRCHGDGGGDMQNIMSILSIADAPAPFVPVPKIQQMTWMWRGVEEEKLGNLALVIQEREAALLKAKEKEAEKVKPNKVVEVQEPAITSMNGWLLRERTNGDYERLYCRMEGNEIRMMREEKASIVAPLESVTICFGSDISIRPNCFMLFHPQRRLFVFSCEKQDEYKMWVKAATARAQACAPYHSAARSAYDAIRRPVSVQGPTEMKSKFFGFSTRYLSLVGTTLVVMSKDRKPKVTYVLDKKTRVQPINLKTFQIVFTGDIKKRKALIFRGANNTDATHWIMALRRACGFE